jgi:hypothetical protein
MQRALVILAVFALVAAGLIAGTLISHWPFWARAWQWQAAADGWPQELPGPTRILRGGGGALPIHLRDMSLPAEAGSNTAMLLVASADGSASAWFAPGLTAASLVDGRALTGGLLPPLYGLLAARHPALLDSPMRAQVASWQDARGEITPRQLLWQLGGLAGGDFRSLNPASRFAQLASGPDFERAARHWPQRWPAGSHFEVSPANAQLLALVAGRASGMRYAELLERELWSQFAEGDAVAVLDHPRGNIAAHCCLRAQAVDWLRLGLLLADDGRIGARQLLPAGFTSQLPGESPVHPGYGLGFRIADYPAVGRVLVLESAGRQLLIAPAMRSALLWVGTGSAPAMLHQLLGAEAASRPSPN